MSPRPTHVDVSSVMVESSDNQKEAYVETMVAVLNGVRRDEARTRPELARLLGLGRNVVSERLTQLLHSGLVVEGEFAPSTGGRAPRTLRFNGTAGIVVAVDLGATGMRVAVCDLNGEPLDQIERDADITEGPETILRQVTELITGLLEEHRASGSVWGIGVGLPGPVEFSSGRPVAPPIMPGWDLFPVREFFAQRFQAPVWVDNDVNLMALGEHRAGAALGEREFVYVKIGSGIGAGIVMNGQLSRGAKGCAGDIGHIALRHGDVLCRCGRQGCLEALAAGAALARDGLAAALDGRSPYLARALNDAGTISAEDVAKGTAHADPVCIGLLTQSGRLVGEALAALVNTLNPSLIMLGGGVADSGDSFLASVKETILARSLPLATRDLRVARSPLGHRAGLVGAAHMVLDELFSPTTIGAWIGARSPAGSPHVATLGGATQTLSSRQ